jgi:LytS/YehU family sensor histidine kinase
LVWFAGTFVTNHFSQTGMLFPTENTEILQAEINRQQQEIREMKSLLLYKNALSQLNPHLLFNTLAGIQHFIMLGDKKAASQYLSLAGDFIRKILKNNAEPFIAIQQEKKLLEQYLRLEQARFNHSFYYQFEVDNADTPIPAMIAFAFAEEALYERVLPGTSTNEKKSLQIHFVHLPQGIEIRLTDNSHMEMRRPHAEAMQVAMQQIESFNKSQEKIISINRTSSPGTHLVTIGIPYFIQP